MRAAVLILLVGCAYKADSFSYPAHEFGGQRATVGCLDLAIQRRDDTRDGAILAYQFGNRCDQPAMVDLVYAQVHGRTETGEEVVLKPYDPNNEMRPQRIDGRSVGGEAIAYESDKRLMQICVDVAQIAHAEGTKILCFSNPAPAVRNTAPLDGPQPQAKDSEDPPAAPLEEPNQVE